MLYSHRQATPAPLPHRIRFADYDLGADRDAWAAYRQALRDLADAPNPFDLTWPQPPATT